MFCGNVCNEELAVYDIKLNNKIIVPIPGYHEYTSPEPTNGLQKGINNLIIKYKILAIGPGAYINTKELPNDKSIEFIKKENCCYELWISGKNSSREKLRAGKLSKDVSVDNSLPWDVDVAGYFINPWNNNHIAIALIIKYRGFEAESDYIIELVGYVLK